MGYGSSALAQALARAQRRSKHDWVAKFIAQTAENWLRGLEMRDRRKDREEGQKLERERFEESKRQHADEATWRRQREESQEERQRLRDQAFAEDQAMDRYMGGLTFQKVSPAVGPPTPQQAMTGGYEAVPGQEWGTLQARYAPWGDIGQRPEGQERAAALKFALAQEGEERKREAANLAVEKEENRRTAEWARFGATLDHLSLSQRSAIHRERVEDEKGRLAADEPLAQAEWEKQSALKALEKAKSTARELAAATGDIVYDQGAVRRTAIAIAAQEQEVAKWTTIAAQRKAAIKQEMDDKWGAVLGDKAQKAEKEAAKEAKQAEKAEGKGHGKVVRTGTAPDGKKVVQYEDGTIEPVR